MRITGTIEGLDVVVSGLENTTLEVREAAFYGVIEALQVAFRASYALLSETDHTLLELAALGHPYSRDHGYSIHEPDEIVHAQTGAYKDGLRAQPPQAAFGNIIEGQVVNADPKDRWIQEGTLTMRARPWMQYVVRHFGDDMANLIEARIRQAVARRAG